MLLGRVLCYEDPPSLLEFEERLGLKTVGDQQELRCNDLVLVLLGWKFGPGNEEGEAVPLVSSSRLSTLDDRSSYIWLEISMAADLSQVGGADKRSVIISLNQFKNWHENLTCLFSPKSLSREIASSATADVTRTLFTLPSEPDLFNIYCWEGVKSPILSKAKALQRALSLERVLAQRLKDGRLMTSANFADRNGWIGLGMDTEIVPGRPFLNCLMSENYMLLRLILYFHGLEIPDDDDDDEGGGREGEGVTPGSRPVKGDCSMEEDLESLAEDEAQLRQLIAGTYISVEPLSQRLPLRAQIRRRLMHPTRHQKNSQLFRGGPSSSAAEVFLANRLTGKVSKRHAAVNVLPECNLPNLINSEDGDESRSVNSSATQHNPSAKRDKILSPSPRKEKVIGSPGKEVTPPSPRRDKGLSSAHREKTASAPGREKTLPSPRREKITVSPQREIDGASGSKTQAPPSAGPAGKSTFNGGAAVPPRNADTGTDSTRKKCGSPLMATSEPSLTHRPPSTSQSHATPLPPLLVPQSLIVPSRQVPSQQVACPQLQQLSSPSSSNVPEELTLKSTRIARGSGATDPSRLFMRAPNQSMTMSIGEAVSLRPSDCSTGPERSLATGSDLLPSSASSVVKIGLAVSMSRSPKEALRTRSSECCGSGGQADLLHSGPLRRDGGQQSMGSRKTRRLDHETSGSSSPISSSSPSSQSVLLSARHQVRQSNSKPSFALKFPGVQVPALDAVNPERGGPATPHTPPHIPPQHISSSSSSATNSSCSSPSSSPSSSPRNPAYRAFSGPARVPPPRKIPQIRQLDQLLLPVSASNHPQEPDDDPDKQKMELLAKYRNVCSEVLPHKLFLSGEAVAADRNILQQHQITHIINAAGDTCPNYFQGSFNYLTFVLQDSRLTNEALESVLPFNLLFIRDAIFHQNGVVLIHCREGVSRSSTIAIAFLMWYLEKSFGEALEMVRRNRSMCNPNTGFTFTLLKFGKRLSRHRTLASCAGGIFERKLCRVTIHHPAAPFIVVLGVSLFEPSMGVWMPGGPALRLDPRFFYVLRDDYKIYVWQGKDVPKHMVKLLKRAIETYLDDVETIELRPPSPEKPSAPNPPAATDKALSPGNRVNLGRCRSNNRRPVSPEGRLEGSPEHRPEDRLEDCLEDRLEDPSECRPEDRPAGRLDGPSDDRVSSRGRVSPAGESSTPGVTACRDSDRSRLKVQWIIQDEEPSSFWIILYESDESLPTNKFSQLVHLNDEAKLLASGLPSVNIYHITEWESTLKANTHDRPNVPFTFKPPLQPPPTTSTDTVSAHRPTNPGEKADHQTKSSNPTPVSSDMSRSESRSERRSGLDALVHESLNRMGNATEAQANALTPRRDMTSGIDIDRSEGAGYGRTFDTHTLYYFYYPDLEKGEAVLDDECLDSQRVIIFVRFGYSALHTHSASDRALAATSEHSEDAKDWRTRIWLWEGKKARLDSDTQRDNIIDQFCAKHNLEYSDCDLSCEVDQEESDDLGVFLYMC